MNIAVITGASSGFGKEFALEIDKNRPEIEEIWLLARRKERLEEVAKELKKPTKILSLDITDPKSLKEYTQTLESVNGNVSLLVNNAGFGKLARFDEISPEDNSAMVRLNCEALTYMTAITLPFMKMGGEIINTCSIASFAPNTRMAVYSSTKAFVLSLSKALRVELKPLKINVLATCPGPMDTEFLSIAGIETGTSRTFDTLPRVNAKIMAKKSLLASKKRKGVYTNRLFYKFYYVLAKVLPHSLVMKMCGT